MVDKYHNEWIIRDMVVDARIFKAQSRAFHFLSDMSYDLDNSIEMLEGIKRLPTMCLQEEFLKRKCLYLRTANSIGRLWGEGGKSDE